jgi:hypothetical protein
MEASLFRLKKFYFFPLKKIKTYPAFTAKDVFHCGDDNDGFRDCNFFHDYNFCSANHGNNCGACTLPYTSDDKRAHANRMPAGEAASTDDTNAACNPNEKVKPKLCNAY